MAFTDAVDSHYQYVRARIIAQNSNRVFGGILTAQDWPSKPIKFDAFYLLVLGESSVGRQGYSGTVPIKFHTLQWVWITKGTDLIQGIKAANRGDKYRIVQQMKQELQNAFSPNFTEKLSWALVATGQPAPNDAKWTGTSKDPKEFIWWTPVEFHEKVDKDSGVMYGSANTRIQDMMDAITT